MNRAACLEIKVRKPTATQRENPFFIGTTREVLSKRFLSNLIGEEGHHRKIKLQKP